MDPWYVALAMLLAHYAPFFIGLAAFALIALATWGRPPRLLRILSSAAGAGILLWAIWFFILRGLPN